MTGTFDHAAGLEVASRLPSTRPSGSGHAAGAATTSIARQTATTLAAPTVGLLGLPGSSVGGHPGAGVPPPEACSCGGGRGRKGPPGPDRCGGSYGLDYDGRTSIMVVGGWSGR